MTRHSAVGLSALTLRPLVAAIAAIVAIGAGIKPATGATRTWIGGTGLWSDAGQWGGAVPGGIDIADIPDGIVAVDGAQAADSLLLGTLGSGTMSFAPAGTLTTNMFSLGTVAGATGTVNMGANNIWTTTNGSVGDVAGSSAEITVSGAGSRLNTGVNLYVGNEGSGSLTVAYQGVVQAGAVMVARGGSATGNVSITGAGSELTTDFLYIGGDRFGPASVATNGTVSVRGGGQLNAQTLFMGDAANSSGTLNVEGPGSALNTTLLIVGNNGAGTMLVSGGATVTNTTGSTYLGQAPGSFGSVWLTGAGTSWVNSDPVSQFTVGLEGIATLFVDQGATLTTNFGIIGQQAGGSSVATVAGVGSAWTSTLLFIGGGVGAAGGLAVAAGGRISTGDAVLGVLGGAYGNATITGDGSVFEASGPVTIGKEGAGRVILMSGGALVAPEVVVAEAAGSTGSLVVGTPVGFGAAPAGVLNTPVVRFGAGNGELLFNFVGPSLTYDGSIQGTGQVNVLQGDLVLTGNSTNTGPTTVSGGSLTVNGVLGGPVNMGAGTTLAGAGTVGATTLASGSTLAPGNTIGTLTVNGDLTFKPGSTYRVEAAPDSAVSDRVVVNGIAHLAGSVLHVGPDGNFTPNLNYTIVSAQAIDGQFDSVASNYAFLDPTLSYSSTDVTLGLSQTRAFPTGADTANQRAVAGALQGMSNDSALRQYVATLAQGQTQAAFDSLSGEIHASVANTMLQGAAQVRATPLAKLRANLQATPRAGVPTAAAGSSDTPLSASGLPVSGALPAWAEVVGNWQTIDGDGNAARVRQHTGGIFVGADQPVGGGWRLGGALGFTDSRARVDDRSSQADISSYSALIYGGRSFASGAGAWNLLLGGGYTWHDIGTRRYADSQTAALTADYGASTGQLFTELSYAWKLSDRTTLEPFAGLAWSDLRTRGFSESGGDAALSGSSENTQQTHTTLGLRASQKFDAAGREARVYGTVGWRHVFGDVKPQARLAFDNSQPFTVAGAPIGRDAALVELGAELAVARSATVGLGYTGQYASGSREHSAQVNVRWQF